MVYTKLNKVKNIFSKRVNCKMTRHIHKLHISLRFGALTNFVWWLFSGYFGERNFNSARVTTFVLWLALRQQNSARNILKMKLH